jgi:hypothetical protein
MGYIDQRLYGTPLQLGKGASQTVPGGTITLLTALSASNVKISKVFVSCRSETMLRVMDGPNLIASGRTGPGSPNFNFEFYPPQPLTSGQNLSIQAFACGGYGTASNSIEGYALGFSNSF